MTGHQSQIGYKRHQAYGVEMVYQGYTSEEWRDIDIVIDASIRRARQHINDSIAYAEAHPHKEYDLPLHELNEWDIAEGIIRSLKSDK